MLVLLCQLISPVFADHSYLMLEPGRKQFSYLTKLAITFLSLFSFTISSQRMQFLIVSHSYRETERDKDSQVLKALKQKIVPACSSPVTWPKPLTAQVNSPSMRLLPLQDHILGKVSLVLARRVWAWGTGLTGFLICILDKGDPLLGIFWAKLIKKDPKPSWPAVA